MPCRFHCQEVGAPGRPVLLLLHGFMGSARDWDEIVSCIANTHHCLAIDLPGHGETVVSGAENYRIDNCAAAVVAYLDEKGIRQCDLVGYSLGGRLALYLAVTYPDRFERVIVESASPGLEDSQERSERLAHDLALAAELETGPLAKFADKWYRQPMFASLRDDREKFRRLLQRRLENDANGLALSLRNMGVAVQPSLWGLLDRISASLLLIVGENDDKFVAVARKMLPRCCRATMAIVQGAGHNVHFERPGEFAAQVSSFLSQG